MPRTGFLYSMRAAAGYDVNYTPRSTGGAGLKFPHQVPANIFYGIFGERTTGPWNRVPIKIGVLDLNAATLGDIWMVQIL
jgi:hypothetical protein